MFFQILWSLESLATEFALMWLERYMDSDMRCDMVALYCRSSALTPGASKIEIVGRLATNMSFANVFLERMC